MNLKLANLENLEYVINEIKSMLRVVNSSIFTYEDFQLSQYEDIVEIYELIVKKQGKLSMMEIEEILGELGSMRKKSKE